MKRLLRTAWRNRGYLASGISQAWEDFVDEVRDDLREKVGDTPQPRPSILDLASKAEIALDKVLNESNPMLDLLRKAGRVRKVK
jgi:hypothetical protein